MAQPAAGIFHDNGAIPHVQLPSRNEMSASTSWQLTVALHWSAMYILHSIVFPFGVFTFPFVVI